MKTFKVGDKVKIPTIGTACIKTSLKEIQESLADYKLDYLYVCDVWEDGEIGLMKEDGVVFEQDLYHERDLEHYEEYNETFNPEAHSSLIIDFDKVETIYEAAEKLHPTGQLGSKYSTQEAFVLGAKSNSARNYWYQKFSEEQKGQDKQQKTC